MVIRTPDYRLRVFVSSTLNELAEERKVVRQAILKLCLAPIMFEAGARAHPAQALYQSYLAQSQIFIAIYWQSYGWIAPGMQISGLEDEYNLSVKIPRLIYIKTPAPDREPALAGLLDRLKNDNSSCYTHFSSPSELSELVQNDLALLLTEQFEDTHHAKQPGEAIGNRPLTNLPIPRNPLIGRENLLAATCGMLAKDDVALVTLTGAGGTGKSRLAIQIGLENLERFRDGVFMVILEPVSDCRLVIPTIAETLGLHESPGSPPIGEMLVNLLRDKQMLLILDNFEQVVDAAPCVSDLIEACPRLKCVVTSRTPLRLRAEKEVLVPPLTVPSINILVNPEGLSQYAAVELFIQRAQAVKPEFMVTNANAPAIAEVCYRLDGLPLAIELAAARIKLLTPQGLLARMEHRFDLLRGGTRDLPERQRTLRGAIDWSYNLLNENEKKLFRRLSIFIGGWTLEAAEAVCDIDADLSQSLDDSLASLIDNNLVLQLEEFNDEPRFGMLSTIHEYAFERLIESDENEIIHHQHAQFFLDFVSRVEPLVRSVERVHWRQVLQQEYGNIRGVLMWIYTNRKCIELGQQLVISVGMFWQFGGYIAEGRQWCALMTGLADDATPKAVRAGLLAVSGELAWTQGDYSSAVGSLDESLELSRSLGDSPLLAFSTLVRGMLASTSFDLPLATSLLQSSLELYNSIGDQWYKALTLAFLGEVALLENDIERAMPLLDQGIALARQQGDPWCMMPSLMSFGQMAVLSNDLTKARTNYQEAVELLRKTGDVASLAWALMALGHVTLSVGDVGEAHAYFLEGLTMADGLGNQGVILISLAGIAALLANRPVDPLAHRDASRLALAARLCGATVPFIEAPGIFAWADSKRLYDSAIANAKSSMDAHIWDKGYYEGQSLAIDTAVSLAMDALKG